MSGETTIVRRRKSDGALFRVHADGREEQLPPPRPARRMTEEEIYAAALSDPDNPPRTAANDWRWKRVPQVKVMRRALGLTQEEFSARYHIPLGTLRDWEQGRAEPDAPARAYLRVIAVNPTQVSEALQFRPGETTRPPSA